MTTAIVDQRTIALEGSTNSNDSFKRMDYGSTNGGLASGSTEVKDSSSVGENRSRNMETFSIDDHVVSTDTSGLVSGSSHRKRRFVGGCCPCHISGSWLEDGLKLTVVCMFVFAIGVTVALIVHISALHHLDGQVSAQCYHSLWSKLLDEV